MSDEPGNVDLEDSIAKIDKAIGGDHSDGGIDALKQALDHSWPAIQKRLSEEAGEKRGCQVDEDGREYDMDDKRGSAKHMNIDEWWLKDYAPNRVLIRLPGVDIFNTQPEHVFSVRVTLWDAYGLGEDEDCDDCFTEDHILAHIQRFPQGQFAAQRISGPVAGNCVGMATTMRTSRPPTAPVRHWSEAIGDMTLIAHESDGDWLYGAEMAVHSRYQGHGIGTGLYDIRFQLVRGLKLRGMYMVGMLMGYHRHADKMSVAEYGEKVIRGEIKDPTASMQMSRGFRAEGVVTEYVDEPAAGNAGVLLVWENPAYDG